MPSPATLTAPAQPGPPSPVDEEAQLRRTLPPSVRIELNVWRGAKVAGSVFLAVSVLVCTATVALAVEAVYVGSWIVNALYFVVLVAALYSAATLYLENQKARRLERQLAEVTPSAPSAIDSSAQDERPWEILPEVVALRAGGKRFYLFGAINAASPYFEIGTVLYIAAALLTSFSPLANPLWRIFEIKSKAAMSILGFFA